MKGVTFRARVRFGAKNHGNARREGKDAGDSPCAPRPRASRAQCMLALAYSIERLIECGELGSYAEGASRLGVSRARMSQIMNLLSLPPQVQDDILTGKLRASERQLRQLSALVSST